jgi:hypothetical protein
VWGNKVCENNVERERKEGQRELGQGREGRVMRRGEGTYHSVHVFCSLSYKFRQLDHIALKHSLHKRHLEGPD